MRHVVMPILTSGLLLAATAAGAQTYAPGYPVCMEVYTIDGRSIECAFTTMAQCAATASGLGATCYPNPNATTSRRANPPAPHRQRRPTQFTSSASAVR